MGNYTEIIKELKSAILLSRYKAASLVNKELLQLYFSVGKFISLKIKQEKWGAKVIDKLSSDLQIELPGLRGFSATNIKRMKLFYEFWNDHFIISPSVTNQLEKPFFNVSFTHHIEILQHCKSLEEITNYITKIATEFWSLSTLKHHLNNKNFANSGSLPNNFDRTIKNIELRNNALQSFKDEYLLDEYIKQPHELPSIGIILGKEKKNKIVEFSFRDFNKAMGVATYKTSTILPKAYKGILPDSETLKKLMD